MVNPFTQKKNTEIWHGPRRSASAGYALNPENSGYDCAQCGTTRSRSALDLATDPGEGRKRLNDTGSGSTDLIVRDGLPVVFISHLSDFPGLIAPSSQAHSQPRMRKDSAAGFFSSHCTYRHRPGSCGVTMTSRRWIMARKILGDKTLPFSSTLMCQPPVSC